MNCKICDGLGNIKGETCVVCGGVRKSTKRQEAPMSQYEFTISCKIVTEFKNHAENVDSDPIHIFNFSRTRESGTFDKVIRDECLKLRDKGYTIVNTTLTSIRSWIKGGHNEV